LSQKIRKKDQLLSYLILTWKAKWSIILGQFFVCKRHSLWDEESTILSLIGNKSKKDRHVSVRLDASRNKNINWV